MISHAEIFARAGTVIGLSMLIWAGLETISIYPGFGWLRRYLVL